MGEAGAFAFFVASGAIGVALLAGPIGQAIARRIAGNHRLPDSGITTGEMAAERVAQLEARVVELEERLDFAERMLSKGTTDSIPTPV